MTYNIKPSEIYTQEAKARIEELLRQQDKKIEDFRPIMPGDEYISTGLTIVLCSSTSPPPVLTRLIVTPRIKKDWWE